MDLTQARLRLYEAHQVARICRSSLDDTGYNKPHGVSIAFPDGPLSRKISAKLTPRLSATGSPILGGSEVRRAHGIVFL